MSCLQDKLTQSKKDFKDEFDRRLPRKHDLIIISGGCNDANSDANDIVNSLGYDRY